MKNLLLAVCLVLFLAAPAMARGGHGGGGHGGYHGGGHNNGHHNHNYNHGRYGYRVAPVYPWWVWVPGYGWVYRNPYVNPYANPYQNSWNTDGNGYGG